LIGKRADPRILFVSTYPPTQCGLATFTRSLVDALSVIRGNLRSIGVFRVVPSGDDSVCVEPEVVAEFCPVRRLELAVMPHNYDLLWIQHEYGIYGPEDGRAVLDLCDKSPVPIAVTLHTVPARPSTAQRSILEGLVARTETAVVMSDSARKRLTACFDVDGRKVQVITHGASVVGRRPRRRLPGVRPNIVSWGLMGPGKGIEWSIQAMSMLRNLLPQPRLIVRGVTHPNVKRREGERYRLQLEMLIDDLDLEDVVELKDGYMSAAELKSFILGGDVALLPYDNDEQVTSGVLIEAIAAGLPVVATGFPHAVELLARGAGTVVPLRDPAAIARALRRYLTDDWAWRAASMSACQTGRQLSWPSVASAYDRLVSRLLVGQTTSVA
jgi:glycosyltransferase involved in cell wall biosynthesis